MPYTNSRLRNKIINYFNNAPRRHHTPLFFATDTNRLRMRLSIAKPRPTWSNGGAVVSLITDGVCGSANQHRRAVETWSFLLAEWSNLSQSLTAFACQRWISAVWRRNPVHWLGAAIKFYESLLVYTITDFVSLTKFVGICIFDLWFVGIWNLSDSALFFVWVICQIGNG